MKLLHQLLWGEFKGNEATAYGNKNEDFVQDSLEHMLNEFMVGNMFNGKKVSGFSMSNPGLVIDLRDPFMAMSPDGVLTIKFFDGTSCRVLLEYKAPFSRRNYKFRTDEEKKEELKKKGKISKIQDIYKNQRTPGLDKISRPIPQYYTPQLCYGMYILQLEHAFFASWVPVKSEDGKVHRIGKDLYQTKSGTIQFSHLARNPTFEKKMIEDVKKFWNDEYIPRLAMKELGELKTGYIDVI